MVGCVVATSGVECSGAADPASCRQLVASIAPDWGFLNWSYFSLLTTTSDRVQKISLTPGSLSQFLAPIDSAQEAVMIARAAQYAVDCSGPIDQAVMAVPGGYQVIATTGSGCGPGMDVYRHTLLVSADGSITDENAVLIRAAQPNCVIGRRPQGLCRSGVLPAQTPLGQHFAAMAQLEAASVDAFVVLRAELKSHGAADSLLRLAGRAAADEVRHARVTQKLALRFHGRPAAAQVRARPLRPLAEIAVENEIEGCVRETYGALLGFWQAEHAADPFIRRAMVGIAADELRHAALAWQVRTWAVRQLGHKARTELQLARRQAISTLRAELAVASPAVVAEAAGLPSPAQALELATRMERELWGEV